MLIGLISGTLTISFVLNLVLYYGVSHLFRTRRNILFNYIKENPGKRAHTIKAEINYHHANIYFNLKEIYGDLKYLLKHEAIIADFAKPCFDHDKFDYYEVNLKNKDWKA